MNWISSMFNKDEESEEVKHDLGDLEVPDEINEAKSAGEPPPKEEIIDSTCHYVCSKVCYGVRGQAGICCCIADRDYIIGPITDPKRFLRDLSNKLGKRIEFDEVFIKFEEGRKMFPDKKCWQDKRNYPAMRVIQDDKKLFPCQFLSEDMKCKVHSIKPKVCREYLCDYLKNIVNTLEESL